MTAFQFLGVKNFTNHSRKLFYPLQKIPEEDISSTVGQKCYDLSVIQTYDYTNLSLW